MPTVWELARRSEEHVKGMVLPGTMFEELGFNYIGPIDGHDIKALVTTLRNMRDLKGPQLLHVVTRKGKGYAPAEADPIKWHGPGPFDPASGTIFKEKATRPHLLAGLRPVAVRHGGARSAHRRHHAGDARRLGPGRVLEDAFPSATSTSPSPSSMRSRSRPASPAKGCSPVVAIYSTFLQRAYDQLIHDVALQNLPVVFALDRAGLVGGDGATHQGSYDLLLPALHPEPDRDGAGRRERMPADALHGDDARRARPRCAIRAARARACAVETR